MPLAAHQFQIGGITFGRGTYFPVSKLEDDGYAISAGDYPIAQSDEMRMTKDYIQPGIISIEMAALNNYAMPGETVEGLLPGQYLADLFASTWRADEARLTWGELKPLLFSAMGEDRMAMGRPRRFARSRLTPKAEWTNIVCDYQKVDPYYYKAEEQELSLTPGSAGIHTATIERSGLGTAPTWLSFYITGPIVNPKIHLQGFPDVEVNLTIAAGKTLEINSYPWQRRVVDTDGINRRVNLVGTSPYLDELKIAPLSSVPVGFSGSGTTGATSMLVKWREAYSTL
jgi:hypothetical protein